jgi:hypothetical protein
MSGRVSKGQCAVPLAALLMFQAASAQTRFSYSSAQTLAPAYEGWWPNDDGSFTLFFGYMNTNRAARSGQRWLVVHVRERHGHGHQLRSRNAVG